MADDLSSFLSQPTPQPPEGAAPKDLLKAYQEEGQTAVDVAQKKGAAQADYTRQEGQYMQGIQKKFEGQYQEAPEFKPTPQSKEDLMGLFGILGAIGAMAGGKSYGSALGAMNAMGGMLGGYQEGRKDLFDREKAEFDKHLQSVKAHNDQITQAFNTAMKMAPYNLSGANAKLQQDLSTFDAQMLRAQVKRQGIEKTGQMWQTTSDKASTEILKRLQVFNAMQKAIQPAGSVDDGTAKMLAEQFISGRTQALSGLGYGSVGAANRTKILNEVSRIAQERGMNGTDLAAKAQEYMGLGAEARALGTSAARIGAAAQEATSLMPIAIAASEAVPRGKFVPINKLSQMAESSISDPALARFKAANNALVNTYVRAISPSGVPTDLVRKEAYSLLQTVDGPEKYKAVVDQMKLEIDAAKSSPEKFLQERMERWKGLPEPPKNFAPIKVSTPDEARKLPSGTPIELPDGSTGVVP